jgi:hypothetical protein
VFVLGVIAVAGALYLPLAITGSTTTSLPVSQQATTLQTMQTTIGRSTTMSFVASPETVETTNSTLGLELSLSVNSTMIPSEDAIIVSASIFNTLPTVNNLTASSDWPVQYLLSGPCDYGNKTLFPAGIAAFSGYYGVNNISSASPIGIWATIECPIQSVLWGINADDQLINISSYSLLPKNDSGYFAYYASSQTVPGVSSMQLSTGGITISANNVTFPSHFYNSLLSSLPGTYTLVAGDEWGQMVLAHFQVVASNNLPIFGSFVAAPSGPSSCSVNGNPAFCITSEFSDAFLFNCAGAAATSSGCTVYTKYTITVWYPYVNQPNETKSANCKLSVQGDPNSPYFGSCFMVNSTAFAVSYPP